MNRERGAGDVGYLEKPLSARTRQIINILAMLDKAYHRAKTPEEKAYVIQRYDWWGMDHVARQLRGEPRVPDIGNKWSDEIEARKLEHEQRVVDALRACGGEAGRLTLMELCDFGDATFFNVTYNLRNSGRMIKIKGKRNSVKYRLVE